jgi:hypothetical protein
MNEGAQLAEVCVCGSIESSAYSMAQLSEWSFRWVLPMFAQRLSYQQVDAIAWISQQRSLGLPGKSKWNR